jgi:hypothetical protein
MVIIKVFENENDAKFGCERQKLVALNFFQTFNYSIFLRRFRVLLIYLSKSFKYLFLLFYFFYLTSFLLKIKFPLRLKNIIKNIIIFIKKNIDYSLYLTIIMINYQNLLENKFWKIIIDLCKMHIFWKLYNNNT